jgi:IS30 family transposase
MLIKVPSKETEIVVAALSRHVRKLPATLRRSLTWNRGLEMAKHKEFTVATDVQVYFCDPQSPWQRGTNENTNLLLRQYFPRRTDLSPFSQAQLDQVSLRLNQRPRKTLALKLLRVNFVQVLRRPSEPATFIRHLDYFRRARKPGSDRIQLFGFATISSRIRDDGGRPCSR